jgi:ribose-phosphate pyrophosphokinase
MKTLNLQYQELSDIKYNIIQFPDGEIQLDVQDDLINFKDSITIKTRIKTTNDLFILLQAYDILDRYCISYDTEIMYLMTQRTDRIFSQGRPLSLKIIMSLLKGYVSVLEPHNIEAMKHFSNNYVDSVYHIHPSLLHLYDDRMIFYPDLGARTRYDCNGMYYVGYGEKVRDVATGSIIDYSIHTNFHENHKINRIVVVDDLCDGGRTFLVAYEKLRELYPEAEINLDITHAVQEAGLRKVCEVFDKVIVTNSYADWNKLGIANLEVKDVWGFPGYIE